MYYVDYAESLRGRCPISFSVEMKMYKCSTCSGHEMLLWDGTCAVLVTSLSSFGYAVCRLY